jgi:hypothetical protein
VDGISQRTSLQTSVENCKYTQHHPIGVGDLPGHQLRVFEIHCTFPNNPPVINGVVLKEQWFRGLTDLTDNSGPGNFYAVYEFANGDKFFTHSTMVAHKAGSGLSAATAGYITGGTGKFAGMRGTIRTVFTDDPAAGVNEGQTEIEYVAIQ